ncbi:hypothetical protein QH494_02585 [Sphingomonas sp. AR_OL41]|uniref:hypothetical protein n=1 Tax=Sphingomonas sp. AR_OL41 TaxID=3042729 RepID=UPI002480D772|nr:hypothetical protein [Sphingomonas sp. AR_OL41]MDH7971056.1 hypothetical protein [Sphingomonas sp. AR_OL41]
MASAIIITMSASSFVIVITSADIYHPEHFTCHDSAKSIFNKYLVTTIATDGQTMASDGQSSFGNTIVNDAAIKIARLNTGALIGTAGNNARRHAVIAWLNDGMATPYPFPEPDDDRDIIALIVDDEGAMFLSGVGDLSAISLPAAIGSGSDFAIGAMLAGATPANAVALAAQRDVWTSGKITTMTVKP